MVEIDLSEYHEGMLEDLEEKTNEEVIHRDLKNLVENAIHSSWRDIDSAPAQALEEPDE